MVKHVLSSISLHVFAALEPLNMVLDKVELFFSIFLYGREVGAPIGSVDHRGDLLFHIIRMVWEYVACMICFPPTNASCDGN